VSLCGFIPSLVGNPSQWYRVFTSMFLHADFFHILFNMYFLCVFGRAVESILGKSRFLLLYLAAGIFASIFHTAFSFIGGLSAYTVPAIGASGAISGILGAYLARATLFGIIPMFATAFILLGSFPPVSAFLMTCITLFLTFLALCQIGVIMSSAILLFKDVSAVMSILNFLFQIATGMFVPLQFMPDPLRILAFLIPLTHGIDLSRHFIMGTSTVWPMEVELGMLLAFILGFGLLAKAAIFHLERKAKKEGLALA